MEALTNEIEEKAWQLIDKIDVMGGSVPAIEQGFIQNEIARSAYEYQRQIENNEKIIVGLNKFQVEENQSSSIFKVDDSIRQVQIQKLQQLKHDRNNPKVDQCLQILNDKAAGGENLIPAVIDAVENKVTLGEIADELRSIFGEYR